MCRLSKSIEEMFASQHGGELYNRVEATIIKENMTPHINNGMLIGLSGGADSVFLLSFLAEYKRRNELSFPILAVHVNHCIRGDEASRDEEFSRSFASSLGIEFESHSIDVPTLSDELGIGLEEAARNARYSVFREILRGRNDISTIAVAHNASDNAETVLMNILRGAGLNGVCGIKPIRENIIRPIISVSKSEILNTLGEFNIPYVTDSTNLSSDYSRNYVRNEIMPLFERISSAPVSAFNRMSANLRSDLEYMTSVAKDFINKECSDRIEAHKLRDLHPAILSKVLSLLIHDNTAEFPEEKHILALQKLLLSDNFSYSLTGDRNFVCERGICAFKDKISKNALNGQIFSLNKGENKISGTNLTVFIGEIDKTSLNVYNFSIQAQISSDIIDNGLTLRFKSDGDSYKYGGMTHKLKKVFNDRNIPASEREYIPVISDPSGILLVPGMSERDGAKDSNKDKNITITFAYATPKVGETKVFTALLRK